MTGIAQGMCAGSVQSSLQVILPMVLAIRRRSEKPSRESVSVQEFWALKECQRLYPEAG